MDCWGSFSVVNLLVNSPRDHILFSPFSFQTHHGAPTQKVRGSIRYLGTASFPDIYTEYFHEYQAGNILCCRTTTRAPARPAHSPRLHAPLYSYVSGCNLQLQGSNPQITRPKSRSLPKSWVESQLVAAVLQEMMAATMIVPLRPHLLLRRVV